MCTTGVLQIKSTRVTATEVKYHTEEVGVPREGFSVQVGKRLMVRLQ